MPSFHDVGARAQMLWNRIAITRVTETIRLAVAGIDAYYDRVPETAAGLGHQARGFNSGGTQYNTLDSKFKQLLYGLYIANAAAQLNGNQQSAGNLVNNLKIHEFSVPGAVEVDDMQARRAYRLPFQSYIQRVIGENRFLIIVTLVKADTASIS